MLHCLIIVFKLRSIKLKMNTPYSNNQNLVGASLNLVYL